MAGRGAGLTDSAKRALASVAKRTLDAATGGLGGTVAGAAWKATKVVLWVGIPLTFVVVMMGGGAAGALQGGEGGGAGGALCGVNITTGEDDRRRVDELGLIAMYNKASSPPPEGYGLGERGPSILAAMNKIESDFGRNMGPSSAGAIGWMQFLPSTWSKSGREGVRSLRVRPTTNNSDGYATDGDGDGWADTQNPADAIHAAARYLSAGGAPADWDGADGAIHVYNHSTDYVNDVLDLASQYQASCPRGGGGRFGRSMGSPGGDGARGIVEQAVATAQEVDPSVYVCSDFRPSSTTTSGGSSDHSSNDATRAARDIAVRDRDCIEGPPSPHLDEAAVRIGRLFGRGYHEGQTIIDTFQWQGYRIQIIWRTPEYGGHMGHIHIGASRE